MFIITIKAGDNIGHAVASLETLTATLNRIYDDNAHQAVGVTVMRLA